MRFLRSFPSTHPIADKELKKEKKQKEPKFERGRVYSEKLQECTQTCPFHWSLSFFCRAQGLSVISIAFLSSEHLRVRPSSYFHQIVFHTECSLNCFHVSRARMNPHRTINGHSLVYGSGGCVYGLGRGRVYGFLGGACMALGPSWFCWGAGFMVSGGGDLWFGGGGGSVCGFRVAFKLVGKVCLALGCEACMVSDGEGAFVGLSGGVYAFGGIVYDFEGWAFFSGCLSVET